MSYDNLVLYFSPVLTRSVIVLFQLPKKGDGQQYRRIRNSK